MEKDSLHNLFNKKFKEPTKGDMNWVNPDDSIFENVLSDLAEDDQKKPIFWRNRYGFLLLLLIPVAGLFAVFATTIADTNVSPISNPIADVQEATSSVESPLIETSEVLIQEVEAKNIDQAYSESGNDQELTNDQSVLSNRFNTNTIINTPSPSPSQFNSSSNNEVDLFSLQENPISPTVIIDSYEVPTLLDSKERSTKTGAVRTDFTSEYLNLLNLRNNIAEFNAPLNTTSLPELVELNPVEISSESNQSFSLAAGYLYTAVSHPNGPLSNEMVMDGHEQFQSGWNIEAVYNKNIGSNWTLHTSLGFNSIQMESLTTCSFNYDSENEFISQGQLMYNTPLTLITPTTGFVDNVEFVIEEGAMSDDDMLTNNLDISQGISTVSLGIGLSNKIFAKKKFSLGVGVNVSLDYIVRIQERMNIELMADDYMLFEKDKEWVNHHGLNRFGASAGINVLAQYQISDKHALFIRPSYRRSLTSVRSGDIITERSYFNIYNISTGITINF